MAVSIPRSLRSARLAAVAAGPALGLLAAAPAHADADAEAADNAPIVVTGARPDANPNADPNSAYKVDRSANARLTAPIADTARSVTAIPKEVIEDLGALSMRDVFRTQPGVAWHVMGEGFTWETQDRARDVATAEAAWAVAREMLQNPGFGLVVLDELNIALKYHYLDVDRVIADLRARPPMQHVVVTGRGAPPALVEAADTVTDMTPVKHAFAAGVKAMPGMEW